MSERDVRCAGSEGAADLRGEAAISHETADGLGRDWPMALDMSNAIGCGNSLNVKFWCRS